MIERPLWLALVAEVCAQAGLTDEAQALVAEGLAVAEAHNIHFHDAELRRLEGELWLAREAPDASRAEAAFHAAIDVARSRVR